MEEFKNLISASETKHELHLPFYPLFEACVPEESAMLYFKESSLSCFSEVEVLGAFHFRGAGEGFVEFGSNAPISPL